MRHFAVLAFAAVALSACGSVDHALQGPGLSPMGYPAALVPQQQAVFIPQQAPASSNSLWRAGARAFFNDQRAKNVGDIVTVVVDIDDRAQTSNTTARTRSNSYQARTPTILGIESSLGKFLPGQYDPANAFATGGESSFNGAGSQQRSEKISITIAAIVTGVLPNGNIVVQGSQEVRTGREVRVLTVSGIARTEDVSAANTIRHTQLAEARISYGGTGDVTRSNTPPASQTLVEKFSPF